MGPYPLFCCSDWSELAADLDELCDSVVSVVLVTDPFGEWTVEQLDCCVIAPPSGSCRRCPGA